MVLINIRAEEVETGIVAVAKDSARVGSWHLYKMVTQNMLRMHDKKNRSFLGKKNILFVPAPF